MPVDYAAIRRDNIRKYGEDIPRVGRMLLADRYADRAHFVFELLQNAEDALRRRGGSGKRGVRFDLTNERMRFSHFGAPFNAKDVAAICGIAESTKGITEIGHFGIGFKSVYTLTDRPEVHSGEEDFAIESYVWPVAAPPVRREPAATVIELPLRMGDMKARNELESGLKQLGVRTLLFLREIEEIEWNIEGGARGLLLRSTAEDLGGARRITLLGEREGRPESEQSWLVFDRPAIASDGTKVGYVEVAFSISGNEKDWHVTPVTDSTLVAFFPTVLRTHVGFLLQAPFRTTPSRDNIPRDDDWNQRLVASSAELVVEALRWFRDRAKLDVHVLASMPLLRAEFESEHLAPVFESVCEALRSESLVPCIGGRSSSGPNTKLARPRELADLFSPEQLAHLLKTDGVIDWLIDSVTPDRAPEVRRYLLGEVGVEEIDPDKVIARLQGDFLERQSDGWIQRLYEFLAGYPALHYRLANVPLARLADGTHVKPIGGKVFLPSEFATNFPTIRRSVCESKESLGFLSELGLTLPDPADDVIRNVLPTLSHAHGVPSQREYAEKINRILAAFKTDSKSRREKLVQALSESAFVAVIDSSGKRRLALPGESYLATQRLKDLFGGVDGISFVDDSYDCLRGDGIREVLEAAGTAQYLRPVDVKLSYDRLSAIRYELGTWNARNPEYIDNYEVFGLSALLSSMSEMDTASAAKRAETLWEALGDLEQRNRGVFTGTYSLTFRGRREAKEFEPDFLILLNSTPWIPQADGNLGMPAQRLFSDLGWRNNSFLQERIKFRPPVIDQLAREVGIEPAVLDLLKAHGLTTVDELLKIVAPKKSPTGESRPHDSEAAPEERGDEPPEGELGGATRKSKGTPGADGGKTPDERPTAPPRPVGGSSGARSNGGGLADEDAASERVFHSYVTVGGENELDPDGLSDSKRRELEDSAIKLIVEADPRLLRTPENNPGFDLYEAGADGKPVRWIEVKAMTGALKERPVGMSSTQFDLARQKRAAYWLYVVERAGTSEARLLRIRDPYGKAKTFSFDSGWVNVAEPAE